MRAAVFLTGNNRQYSSRRAGPSRSLAALGSTALLILSGLDRGEVAASVSGAKMGTKKSRRRFLLHLLAGAAIGAALALPAPLASADEAGESFWTPGSFGSLAATPVQPGFSLSSGYYHTSTTAGS